MAETKAPLPVRTPGSNGTSVGGERQPVPQAQPVPVKTPTAK